MKRIDVHHHMTPDFYVEKLESVGIKEAYGEKFPKWTPEKSLKNMKKLGIDIAMLSISTPGVYFKDEEFSKELARMCNEYMAKVKEDNPNKFGSFATIPLPYVKSAIEELKYALDVLKLDGVCLYPHYDVKYLGNSYFDEFFEELNKRKTVVYIHPSDPVEKYDPKLEIPNSLIEAAFETTRVAANLVHSGATDRYPDVKYILSHGGGAVPYLAWRIALTKYLKKEVRPSIPRMIYDFMIKKGPISGLNILKNMYYDTALTTSPYALKALQEFVGSERIVFGSDLPFSEKIAPMIAKDLNGYEGFTDKDFEAINYKNCLDLFPSLKII